MHPVFDGSYPIIRNEWVVPQNMYLYLTAHITNTMECVEQHLVAVDSYRKTWRLPVSNLYQDCRLCPGRFDAIGRDIIEVLNKVWSQFMNGSWNADLYGDSTSMRRSGTKALFTYDITNSATTQQAPPKNWQDCCEKAATDFITNYINY